MKSIKYHLLIFFTIICQDISAQNYIAPVDFKLLLSGTFGELRSNHFHAGIDIKTQGVEGQEVKSIADGYVSRIKVSTWGYGKVIYITHPETGHTSVYAHLQGFSEKIDKLVKKEHYKKESFEINFFPKKDELIVKQGEIIGLSGNSGGSNGAHLHFEIRETRNAHPINPLQFEFNVTDNIPPILKKLKIYAFDTTLINGYNTSKVYDLQKQKNNYLLNETPEIKGDFALGIFTYDQAEGAYNKNGVYAIKMYIDSLLYYDFKVDELDFSTSRYINAHIDYYEKKESKYYLALAFLSFTALAISDVGIKNLNSILPILLISSVFSLMMIGHWFLVDPTIDRSGMKNISKFSIYLSLVLSLLVFTNIFESSSEFFNLVGNDLLNNVIIFLYLSAGILSFGSFKSLQEKSYTGVMASTGLSYLSLIVSLGASGTLILSI